MKPSSIAATVAIAASLQLGAAEPLMAEQLTSMNDVGEALQACWTPPADVDNASVTLSFSFKRDGSLIGPPKATAINFDGDDTARKAFVDAAIAAVQGCVPLDFSSSIADGIAGGVYTMQFTSRDD